MLLVAGLLRQALPEAAIGLFVHTPFPSSEVFRYALLYTYALLHDAYNDT